MRVVLAGMSVIVDRRFGELRACVLLRKRDGESLRWEFLCKLLHSHDLKLVGICSTTKLIINSVYALMKFI